jgi:hypothetical protein
MSSAFPLACPEKREGHRLSAGAAAHASQREQCFHRRVEKLPRAAVLDQHPLAHHVLDAVEMRFAQK